MNSCKIVGNPSLAGSVTVPPSKSHSMRAILFGALASGESKIDNLLDSPDVEAMLRAVQQMGAQIVRKENRISIRGVERKVRPCDIVDGGNSGIILRFVGAVCAAASGYTLMTGDESLKVRRPVAPLLHGIKQLGGYATSVMGIGAPILVRGPLQAGEATIDGADSQPVSALLIVMSMLEGASRLCVEHPAEVPWIEMTLSWLRRVEISLTHQDYQTFEIQGGPFTPFTLTIPGDYSSALYPAAAAFVTRSEIQIEGLDPDDVQGDKRALALLKQLGEGGCEIDVGPFVDALPLLAVLGCYAKGKTVLRNGAIARKKESDRIGAIASELKKMGARITELEDGLVVEESALCGTHVATHNDHRIAMSLAIAALGARGETEIENPAVVAKSYPTFWRDMRSLGCRIG